MSTQPRLFELDDKQNPLECPYDTGERFENHLVCNRNGHRVWVNCQTSVCGEPPMCVWEEPDNSPEAKARRVEWMKRHERTNQN